VSKRACWSLCLLCTRGRRTSIGALGSGVSCEVPLAYILSSGIAGPDGGTGGTGSSSRFSDSQCAPPACSSAARVGPRPAPPGCPQRAPARPLAPARSSNAL